MSILVKATVSIVGTRPVLWHHFGPEALSREERERTGVAGNDPEEWKRTVLCTGDRQLYFESAYVFGCLRDAGQFAKVGRFKAQKFIAATLQLSEDRVLLDRYIPADTDLTTDASQPVYLDVRGVVNPTTRKRNVRYRIAASPGWCTAFTLIWDAIVVPRDIMREIVGKAGILVGLGDGRTQSMGRFTINDYIEDDWDAKEKTAS